MTTIQNILGKYYKWLYFATFSYRSSSASLNGNLINVLAETIKISAVVYVWYYKGSEASLFIYLLLGQMFRSLGQFYFYNRFAELISTGKITNKLLLPTNNMPFYGVGGIGYRINPNFIEAVAPVLTLILFQFFTGLNLFQYIDPFKFLLMIIAFLPMAYIINYLTGYFVGSLAFFVKDKRETWGISTTATNLISVLSGTIIPLDKIPFSSFFSILPTSFALHHPMQIYLGKYSQVEIIQTFTGGIVWCFVLWIIARLVFKAGLKKNEAVGL